MANDSWVKRTKPFLFMIFLQFAYAILGILSTIAMSWDMSPYIMSTYCSAVGFLVVSPFAYYFERNSRPNMTLLLFLRIALLGFLQSVMDRNFSSFTLPTYDIAISNTVPATTLVVTLLLRIETLNFKRIHSFAKLIGTPVIVAGVVVMSLYRGPVMDIVKNLVVLYGIGPESGDQHHWIASTLLIVATCFGYSFFLVLQDSTLEMYPAELSLTAWISFMGMVEGAVVSLFMERDHMNSWKIAFYSWLLPVLHNGVVCKGLAVYVQGKVVRERGPLFVASFSPLCMVIIATTGPLVLVDHHIYLGSIIGAVLVITGLYLVVWGKSKDPKKPATSQEINDNATQENTTQELQELTV